MRLVTAGLDNIRMNLDDAIGSDDCPINHVTTLATFFAQLRLHKLKLSPDKSRIRAARVDLLCYLISVDSLRPNDDRITALFRMPMPSDIKQLRSLLGGFSYYRWFLPDMARRIYPITALLKKGATFEFTTTMKDTVRALLAELATPPILVFPDWGVVTDKSRPFRLHATLARLASEPPSSRTTRRINTSHCLHQSSNTRQRAELDLSGTRSRMHRLAYSFRLSPTTSASNR